MLLSQEEQDEIQEAVENKTPADFGLEGYLWTLSRTRRYIKKRFRKEISERSVSDYMRRWGMTCQRPVKRARKQNPSRI